MATSVIKRLSPNTILTAFRIYVGNGEAIIFDAYPFMSTKRRLILWCFASSQSADNSFQFRVFSGNEIGSTMDVRWTDGRTETITLERQGDNIRVVSNGFSNAWGSGFGIVNNIASA